MAEVRIADDEVIEAPVNEVWAAIKDPASHARWHPFVTRITGEHRLGATRSCSVLVGKKSGETRERCVEDEEERTIIWAIEDDSTGFSRMVSDWRSGFTLESAEGATRVIAESVFRPKSILIRTLSPFVRRKFHQAQRSILAGLKRAVENGDVYSQAASSEEGSGGSPAPLERIRG